MVKKLWVLFVATVVISMLVQGATASIYLRNPQVGDTVQFWGSGNHNGGPFTAKINYQDGGSTTWTTFCVEHQEYIYNNGTLYKMDPLDPWTMTKAKATQNVVSDKAKWLFHEFNAGALNAYTGSQVQDAIWSYIQAGDSSGPLWDPLDVDSGLVAVANSMPTGWDSSYVRIMNPYLVGNAGSDNAQSVLYETPEPVSFIVWSLLGGLGLIYAWRKRKTT